MNKKVWLYGFLLWLIPFVVAFLIYPIHESNRPLFESIMPVTIVIALVCFSVCVFDDVKKDFVREGVRIGLIWLGISLVFDLFMFSWGPMKMALAEYMSDVGVTYLMIPTITVGFGKLLERRK
jgi:galactitol-specific phosphotransferase system IIC component